MHRLRDLQSGKLARGGRFDVDAMERLRRLGNGLRARGVGVDAPVGVFFVPGRIEVLGKHTDYAGGRSLVAATEQGIWMAASLRADRQVRITDLRGGTTAEFEVDSGNDASIRDWSLYPRAVASRLALNLDSELMGAELVFASDLPVAAGLSSSSALVVATYMALVTCNDLESLPRFGEVVTTRERLAAYLGAVENGRDFGPFVGGQGVGTRGGDEDHTAILCGGRGEIRQYSYLPTRLEKKLELPLGLRFAIAVSGVAAVKTGAAREDYNRASRLVDQLTDIWNRRTGRRDTSLAEVVSSSPRAFARLEAILNDDDEQPRSALLARLRHFVRENEELVPRAGSALERQDLDDFGTWVDRSQELATRLLGNQIDETVWLASSARQLGAVAASAFGAGFGGSVWAMVRQDEEAEFLARWSAEYAPRFPERAASSNFFCTGAGGPAVEL